MHRCDIDRTTWRSLRDTVNRLNDARDATEHMDNVIASRDPSAGGSLPFINPRKSELEIKGTVIRYAELVSWIRQVHAIVQKLASDVPPVSAMPS